MSQSKNSTLRGEENETISGGEEQSSRAGGWKVLAFIILCTITTILDKRSPRPSTASMEQQGNNSKGRQIEPKLTYVRLMQFLKSAQFWGNIALILIQVALFALFHLVEYHDKAGGGSLAIRIFGTLLIVGILLYAAATKVGFALIIIIVMGLVFAIAVSTVAVPEDGNKGLGWIMGLTIFQAGNLLIAWWASTKIKRTPENNSGAAENAQTEAQLTRRARNYSWINLIVGVLGASIAVVPILEIRSARSMGSAELYGNVFMAFLSLAGFVMFLSRFCWMRRARNYGYQVTDNPDDYTLERTTFLAWLLLVIVLAVQYCTGRSIVDFGLETVGGWIIALAFWTPIVSIVGSSWGKLKAKNPNGNKAVWPCRWSRVKEVKA